jgi:peptide/nickel transport system permease protein
MAPLSGTAAFGTDPTASPIAVGPELVVPENVIRSSEMAPGAGNVPEGPEGGEAQANGGFGRLMLRAFLEHKLAVVSLALLILIVLFCWVGPLIYHTNQTNQQQALFNPLNGPPGTSGHPLGTTQDGWDELGRLMFGGQASLTVGLLSALIATVMGVVYGAVAGFVGGWFDAAMMRLVDIVLSIPGLFLLITLVTIFRASESLDILVIAGISWLVPSRLVRGETLSLRTREYVQAVRAMGGGAPRIIGRHIIPNAVGTIVVFATLQVATSILILAALGFLGFGIPAPNTDWGSMVSNAISAMGNGWWWEFFPAGIMIILVVISFNFIGDALRDALEVRTQRR